MKVIYMQDNGVAAVMGAAECSRLALSVTLSNGEVIRSEAGARPVDTFIRPWPASGAVAEWAETEVQWVSRAAARSVPVGVTFEIVEDSAIPADRTFRNAWKHGAGAVTVDISMAKDLTKNRLRAERKPLLEAQDVLFQRALETDASTAEIVKEKQRLRDITKQVDALTSLDELKALGL